MAIKLPLIMASQSSIFHPVTNHLQLVESFTLQTELREPSWLGKLHGEWGENTAITQQKQTEDKTLQLRKILPFLNERAFFKYKTVFTYLSLYTLVPNIKTWWKTQNLSKPLLKHTTHTHTESNLPFESSTRKT